MCLIQAYKGRNPSVYRQPVPKLSLGYRKLRPFHLSRPVSTTPKLRLFTVGPRHASANRVLRYQNQPTILEIIRNKVKDDRKNLPTPRCCVPAGVMLPLVFSLLGRIAGQTCNGAADGAGETVSHAGGEVVHLATGFLLLAGQVLLSSRLLE